jgi:hypothetical protein
VLHTRMRVLRLEHRSQQVMHAMPPSAAFCMRSRGCKTP